MQKDVKKLTYLLMGLVLLFLIRRVGITLIRLESKFFFSREAQRLASLLNKDKNILDVGSGWGYFADSLRGLVSARIVCSDIQDRHLGRSPFILADGCTLPFPNKSFDSVTMFYVLHHSNHPEDLLREARRISRSKILIHEDTYRNFYEEIVAILHVHSFRYFVNSLGMTIKTDQEWQRLFTEIGLRVIYKRPIHRIGYPLTRYEYLLEVSHTDGLT